MSDDRQAKTSSQRVRRVEDRIGVTFGDTEQVYSWVVGQFEIGSGLRS